MSLISFETIVSDAKRQFEVRYTQTAGRYAALYQVMTRIYRPAVKAHLRIVIPHILIRILNQETFRLEARFHCLRLENSGSQKHIDEVLEALQGISAATEGINDIVRDDLQTEDFMHRLEQCYTKAVIAIAVFQPSAQEGGGCAHRVYAEADDDGVTDLVLN